MGFDPNITSSHSTLAKTVRVIAGFLSSINRGMAIVAGSVILFISFLIVMNVSLRYLTGNAIIGVEEIIQVGMVPVIFLSIGYCGQIGGHIRVDILEPYMSRNFRRVVDPIIRIIGAVAFAAMAWQAVQSGYMAGEFNELSNIRKIPHQPIWFLLAIGATFAAVIEFSKLWSHSKSPLVIEDEPHEQ
jgi:TRAP-type transport system small permease protein